ncbi:MAG: type II secretion system ATPase GspE [Pseudomonadota bacterium]
MKTPWDRDSKTVPIKIGEATEVSDPDTGPAIPKGPHAKKPLTEEQHKVAQDRTVRMDAPSSFAMEQSGTFKTLYGIDLGQILLKTSRLKPEQLEEALVIKREQGAQEMLGEILLRKKFITEGELLLALSAQLGIPIAANLGKEEIDVNLATKVPINFAKKFSVVPIRMEGGFAIVAIANGNDLSPLDDLRILLQSDVKPALARKSEILDAINRVYDRATKASEGLHEDLMEDLEAQGLDNVNFQETQDLLDSEDEAPIIRLVNSLLFQAVKERASDIHIEPFEKEISVRFRIDGVLYDIMRPPKKAQASISSRVKIMAQLDIAEKRIPQDGRIRIKIGGRDVDIRVSTLPTSHGERIVMRLLDTSKVLLNLTDIGFSTRQLGTIEKVLALSHGIFLVTGPTGSGKTTTLYACLSKINSKELNIITVEDPVEIQLQGIGQIQVNPKVDLTFANGLRSILRQDPDVIMVGEIRDLETAEIAIQASLTGHLVFSTLHTNDAVSAVTRLVDMGVEPFLVSSSLVAVMAQRLIRVVCKECREPHKPTETELKELAIDPVAAAKGKIFRAKGCGKCSNTGYLGRSGIYEMLPIDEVVRSLILKASDASTLKKVAVSRGMKTLREDGAYKVLQGVTTIEEVLRVTQEEMVIE